VSGTSTNSATATTPWGVTVEVRWPITSPFTGRTGTPAFAASRVTSSRGSPEGAVKISSTGAPDESASTIPCTPSTRNRRSRSRMARFLSRTARATRLFCVEVIIPDGPGPSRRVEV
jgi:hypothetical protein